MPLVKYLPSENLHNCSIFYFFKNSQIAENAVWPTDNCYSDSLR